MMIMNLGDLPNFIHNTSIFFEDIIPELELQEGTESKAEAVRFQRIKSNKNQL